jgi:hypothetical protein
MARGGRVASQAQSVKDGVRSRGKRLADAQQAVVRSFDDKHLASRRGKDDRRRRTRWASAYNQKLDPSGRMRHRGNVR